MEGEIRIIWINTIPYTQHGWREQRGCLGAKRTHEDHTAGRASSPGLLSCFTNWVASQETTLSVSSRNAQPSEKQSGSEMQSCKYRCHTQPGSSEQAVAGLRQPLLQALDAIQTGMLTGKEALKRTGKSRPPGEAVPCQLGTVGRGMATQQTELSKFNWPVCPLRVPGSHPVASSCPSYSTSHPAPC